MRRADEDIARAQEIVRQLRVEREELLEELETNRLKLAAAVRRVSELAGQGACAS